MGSFLLLMQTSLESTDAFWVYTVQISTFELFAIHTHPHSHLCCKGSTQLATIYTVHRPWPSVHSIFLLLYLIILRGYTGIKPWFHPLTREPHNLFRCTEVISCLEEQEGPPRTFGVLYSIQSRLVWELKGWSEFSSNKWCNRLFYYFPWFSLLVIGCWKEHSHGE